MRRRRVLGVALALVLATGLMAEPAAAAPPNLAAVRARVVPFVSGLSSPVSVAWRPGGDTRMYVAEQTGRVRMVTTSGQLLPTIVLNLAPYVSHGGEQGLLGIAFSRDGKKIYADYTDARGDIHVVEWTMKPDTVDITTRRELLFVRHPTFGNHNGGQVVVGQDNMLYVSFGDGGGAGDVAGNAQNRNTLLGKIVRIDPRPLGSAQYRIPPDNPFVGRPGMRPEIWMWGLRNPWRFTLDRATRDMWIGDVGQSLWEEVDYAPFGLKGVNWGWNKREGAHPYNGGIAPPGARNPLFERSHSTGDCSVTGGYVYRGNGIANLNGAYVFGDFCLGRLRAIVQTGGVVTQNRDLALSVPQLSTFGEGPLGELYPVSLSGTIYKLLPA